MLQERHGQKRHVAGHNERARGVAVRCSAVDAAQRPASGDQVGDERHAGSSRRRLGAADQADVVVEAGEDSSWRSMIVRPPTTSPALSAPPRRLARPPARIAAAQARRGEGRRRHARSGTRRVDRTARAGVPIIGAGNVTRKMSEPRIGRLVVAALHQAIAETLPLRLEFYENWLKPLGLLKEGKHIGMAPFTAALSFLRREESALYDSGDPPRRRARRRVDASTRCRWTRRRWLALLPARLRARAALRLARPSPRRLSGHQVRGRAAARTRPRGDPRLDLLPGARAGRSRRSAASTPASSAGCWRAYGIDGAVTLERVPRRGRAACRMDRRPGGRGATSGETAG